MQAQIIFKNVKIIFDWAALDTANQMKECTFKLSTSKPFKIQKR